MDERLGPTSRPLQSLKTTLVQATDGTSVTRETRGIEITSTMKRCLRETWCCGLRLLILSLALTSVSDAAIFDELFSVSVERNSEVPNQRSDAIRRAMRLLLIRITGSQQAAALPETQQLIDNAERYLAGYDLISATSVRVGFDPFQIDETLTRLNVPIWGAERPMTLLWMTVDFGDGQRAELKAADRVTGPATGPVAGIASDPLSEEAMERFDSIAEEILSAAAERGLPIVLPMQDAEDREPVRLSDVSSGFDDRVARAAQRHSADAILIAHVVTTDTDLNVQWTLQRGERRETLTTPQARMGIDWLADEFASELATKGDTREAWITVKDIRSWADWSVIDHLESLSVVHSVDVESMTGSEVVLRVVARGNDTQLLRYLILDGDLLPAENESGLVFVPSRRNRTEGIRSAVNLR